MVPQAQAVVTQAQAQAAITLAQAQAQAVVTLAQAQAQAVVTLAQAQALAAITLAQVQALAVVTLAQALVVEAQAAVTLALRVATLDQAQAQAVAPTTRNPAQVHLNLGMHHQGCHNTSCYSVVHQDQRAVVMSILSCVGQTLFAWLVCCGDARDVYLLAL